MRAQTAADLAMTFQIQVRWHPTTSWQTRLAQGRREDARSEYVEEVRKWRSEVHLCWNLETETLTWQVKKTRVRNLSRSSHASLLPRHDCPTKSATPAARKREALHHAADRPMALGRDCPARSRGWWSCHPPGHWDLWLFTKGKWNCTEYEFSCWDEISW